MLTMSLRARPGTAGEGMEKVPEAAHEHGSLTPVVQAPHDRCAPARRTAGVEAALRLPAVMTLVVGDACTVIALRDRERREPSFWRPWVRRRRRAEGRRLRAEELRVRELAVRSLDAPD